MRHALLSAARQSSAAPGLPPAQSPQADVSRAHLARPSPEAAAEIARYIAQMTAEMAGMAGAARLEMLAYFLDMARNEAEMAIRSPHG